MNKNKQRGFTVQVTKSYAHKFMAPSKFPISGDTIVLLPWEAKKLAETLNEYFETHEVLSEYLETE